MLDGANEDFIIFCWARWIFLWLTCHDLTVEVVVLSSAEVQSIRIQRTKSRTWS